ncbi:MAG: DUF3788 domain-containing protein [Clostridia bacterium]|nr:DUF3788 domain-containing protein [Clostridia bacterium]
MTWSEQNTKADEPALTQIAEYIGSPLWQELCGFVEMSYGTLPKVEYSTCSGAPGWNVKYKKNGRALCTLYPHKGFFTCLICIGAKEAMEAELVLSACLPYTRELYQKAKPFSNTRWLMIDVTSEAILEDVKRLLYVRAKPKQKRS